MCGTRVYQTYILRHIRSVLTETYLPVFYGIMNVNCITASQVKPGRLYIKILNIEIRI